MESVDDGAGALAGSDSVTNVNHAVVKLIPLFYQHGDAPACRNQHIDACKRIAVPFPKTKAIVLLVLVHEMDPAEPRFHLDFAAGDGFLLTDGNRCGPGQGSFPCSCCSCCSHGVFSFQSLLLSAGPETGVSEEPVQGGPLLKIRQSIAVLETILCVLDGALTVAEIVISFRDIGENPRILRCKGEGSIRARDGSFAQFVLCIEHAEHGLYGGFLGIQ